MSFARHAQRETGAGDPGQQQSQARASDGRTEAELLQSTRRALAEADEISTHTLGTLHGQTEQLHRIQTDADAIDSNLDQSEFLLSTMKPWGFLKSWFKKPPKQQEPLLGAGAAAKSARGSASSAGSSSSGRANVPASSRGDDASSTPAGGSRGAARLLADDAARKQAAAGSGYPSSGRPGGSGYPSTDNVKTSGFDQCAEHAKAYDEIDNILDSLKHKTSEINKTLHLHNEMLPQLDKSIDRQNERIGQQTRDVKNLRR